MSIEKSNDDLPISDLYQRLLGAISETYDRGLITNLAKDLALSLGKGFSYSNVIRFRQFYLCYPKGAIVLHLLRWSHIIEFLKIDDLLLKVRSKHLVR